MFKISSKSFTQQRATLKPLKNVAIFEEEEEEEDAVDDTHTLDDASSCYSNGATAVTTHDSRNETLLLAQFFSTTGPEEFVSKHDTTKQQFKRASRLLSRLRKKPTISALRSGSAVTEPKKNHIPLPAYESLENVTPTVKTSFTKETKNAPAHLRDSGVYSETASERDPSVSSYHYTTMPPLPGFLTDLQQFPQPPTSSYKSYPRRPAPLPPAIASAAIASASTMNTVSISPTTVCSSSPSTVRSVPEAALRRRSVRLRHVQVQTDFEPETSLQEENDRKSCPHCRQLVGKDSTRTRRPSCPPALSSGSILTTTAYEEEGDRKALLAMVIQLKSQLAEEKQTRLQLEKAISKDKKVELAKEKDKWAGDCLWLNDRIALLPE